MRPVLFSILLFVFSGQSDAWAQIDWKPLNDQSRLLLQGPWVEITPDIDGDLSAIDRQCEKPLKADSLWGKQEYWASLAKEHPTLNDKKGELIFIGDGTDVLSISRATFANYYEKYRLVQFAVGGNNQIAFLFMEANERWSVTKKQFEEVERTIPTVWLGLATIVELEEGRVTANLAYPLNSDGEPMDTATKKYLRCGSLEIQL